MLFLLGTNTTINARGLLSDSARVNELTKENELLKAENEKLKEECAWLRKECNDVTFGSHWIKEDDKCTRFYTGLPTYAVFILLCNFLRGKAENLKAWQGEKTTTPATNVRVGPRPWKNMSVENQFFSVLVRLRLGVSGADVAARFGMPEGSYSRLFSTWIMFLAKEFKLLFPWPSRDRVHKFMPACFKTKFPTTQVIIDCMEI